MGAARQKNGGLLGRQGVATDTQGYY